MRVEILPARGNLSVTDIIRTSHVANIFGAEKTLSSCVAMSTESWVGKANGGLACAWGLIPPSLMSDRAYIWMLHTSLVGEYKFFFVRHSQLAVEDMLQRYSLLYGHCDPRHEGSVQWLKWLGAEFDKPDGVLIPFQIRAAKWSTQ